MQVSFHVSLIPLVIAMLVGFVILVPLAIVISNKLMTALENRKTKRSYKLEVSEKAVIAMIKAQNSDDIQTKIELTNQANNYTLAYELTDIHSEDSVTLTLSSLINDKLETSRNVHKITTDMQLGELLRHFSDLNQKERERNANILHGCFGANKNKEEVSR